VWFGPLDKAEGERVRGLKDKVALIAGGGQGSGAASARRLASEGCKVVVGDLRLERAQSIADEITQSGGSAAAKRFDLADEDAVKEFIAFGVDTFGGVDLLHNVGANIGLGSAIQSDADVVNLATDVWEQTMQVNLRGYLFTCRYAIPEMLKRGGGAIVNTSSMASIIGMPDMVAYGVSKAGVEALTRSIVTKWASRGIRANAIAPGQVDTPSGKLYLEEFNVDPADVSLLGRPAAPEEIAALTAFLLSDECPYLTGQVIAVNGGLYLSPQ